MALAEHFCLHDRLIAGSVNIDSIPDGQEAEQTSRVLSQAQERFAQLPQGDVTFSKGKLRAMQKYLQQAEIIPKGVKLSRVRVFGVLTPRGRLLTQTRGVGVELGLELPKSPTVLPPNSKPEGYTLVLGVRHDWEGSVDYGNRVTSHMHDTPSSLESPVNPLANKLHKKMNFVAGNFRTRNAEIVTGVVGKALDLVQPPRAKNRAPVTISPLVA